MILNLGLKNPLRTQKCYVAERGQALPLDNPLAKDLVKKTRKSSVFSSSLLKTIGQDEVLIVISGPSNWQITRQVHPASLAFGMPPYVPVLAQTPHVQSPAVTRCVCSSVKFGWPGADGATSVPSALQGPKLVVALRRV